MPVAVMPVAVMRFVLIAFCCLRVTDTCLFWLVTALWRARVVIQIIKAVTMILNIIVDNVKYEDFWNTWYCYFRSFDILWTLLSSYFMSERYCIFTSFCGTNISLIFWRTWKENLFKNMIIINTYNRLTTPKLP